MRTSYHLMLDNERKINEALDRIQGHTRDIPVGSKVWKQKVLIGRRSKGEKKLLGKYDGPYTVVEKVGRFAYKLKDKNGVLLQRKVHIDRLKNYYSPPTSESPSEDENEIPEEPPGVETSPEITPAGAEISRGREVEEENPELTQQATDQVEEQESQPHATQRDSPEPSTSLAHLVREETESEQGDSHAHSTTLPPLTPDQTTETDLTFSKDPWGPTTNTGHSLPMEDITSEDEPERHKRRVKTKRKVYRKRLA